MPKTKVYEPEFKKKIVRLYLEEGCTIKSLNKEYHQFPRIASTACVMTQAKFPQVSFKQKLEKN